jgi:sugar (pentulose or hexulose) kinase
MDDRTSTLVLDIGKSNARLMLIAADGAVRRAACVNNESVRDATHGFLALGVGRLQDWLLREVPGLLAGEVPARVSVTTHGAAFCAIDDDGLVLPPIDYEWDGYDGVTAAFDASLANFAHHGTPRLGQGLNGGRQIDFVHRRWPGLARRIRYWLPYAQYWSWWLSGEACTEVSSLGCHTGLWAPAEGRYSDWAVARGIAERFAPLRRAWDVVGTLRPALARAWSLPSGIEITAGVHDSNACLARHLRAHPLATVVSTGTWCIVMAPGADATRLAPERDELVNVAVDGRGVPTARFMGGREFAALCAGADPALATPRSLAEVAREGWTALPSFAEAGGPFAGRPGRILHRGAVVDAGVVAVPERLRPALATIYCACLGALLVDDLAGPDAATMVVPVILEGPLALNLAYGPAMAALLPSRPVLRSTDPLEGTARGAWMLAHWDSQVEPVSGDAALRPVTCDDPALAQAVRAHAQAWRASAALA